MLALARGEGQSIIIDGNIEVKIVKWSRSSVRIAIQAPREITVDRDEIWRKMHPGEPTPLEKAEKERAERFAREGGPVGHATRPEVALHLVKVAVAGKIHMRAAAGAVVMRETIIAQIEMANGELQDVPAGHAGTVTGVVVTEGQAVQAGQVLVSIKGGI